VCVGSVPSMEISGWRSRAQRTSARAAIAGIVAALAVAGCSDKQGPQPSPTNSMEVTIDELTNQKFVTRDVTLAVGDTLELTLGSNGSTGYLWSSDAQIADPAVIRQTSHGIVPSTSELPGAPGTEIWTFKALKSGATTIAMDYSRPWEGGEKGTWTFKANVTVK
jgi:inhibitor of cysteine peptidase